MAEAVEKDDAGAENQQATTKQQTAKTSPKFLDLAFAMDCTGSMGSYIDAARQNIHTIVEKIVSEEKADVHLALVEYRDHPPQDSSFITNVHDFTPSVRTMKTWLNDCAASGGGDAPEAVADALHALVKLSWREDSAKVCVLISDAPPHGLQSAGDGFPNGCPLGLDPMQIIGQIAEKGITLYSVGCEPSINPYKDFFMSLAYATGGQYVPLRGAHLLTQVILGGAAEELSLQQLMQEVNDEVQQQFGATEGDVDQDEVSHAVFSRLKSKGVTSKQLKRNKEEVSEITSRAKGWSNKSNMADLRKDYESGAPEPASGSFLSRMFRFGSAPPPPPPASMPHGAPPMMAMASPAAGPPPPPPPSGLGHMDDMYDCVEDDISYQQASRMVQKSIAQNALKSRVKKS